MAKQKETKSYLEMIDFVTEMIDRYPLPMDQREHLCEILAFAYGKELPSVKASIQVKLLQLECLKRLDESRPKNRHVKTVIEESGDSFYRDAGPTWKKPTPLEDCRKDFHVMGSGGNFLPPAIKGPYDTAVKSYRDQENEARRQLLGELPEDLKGLGESTCSLCEGSGLGAFTFGCAPKYRSIQQPCSRCNGRKTVPN